MMIDEFAEGWMRFQIAVDEIRDQYKSITMDDLKQYVKMYVEDNEE